MRTAFLILGPTSSGKTSLALDLIRHVNGAIISADSRQIYKKMDAGTGKTPIGTNLNGAEIWGYDLANPDEYFSAYDWASLALPQAKKILEAGKTLFVVGGTGFYIDIFTARVQPSQIKPDFELRKELEAQSLENLQKLAMSLNQSFSKTLDLQNPARLIRAIEIELGKKSATPLPYLENVQFEFLGLTAPREFLYARADRWLEAIWPALISETRELLSAGYSSTKPLTGLLYKSAKAFISGEFSEEAAKSQASTDLHHYIKRQQTYFKRNPQITWFDISDPNFAQKVLNHVKSKVDG